MIINKHSLQSLLNFWLFKTVQFQNILILSAEMTLKWIGFLISDNLQDKSINNKAVRSVGKTIWMFVTEHMSQKQINEKSEIQ